MYETLHKNTCAFNLLFKDGTVYSMFKEPKFCLPRWVMEQSTVDDSRTFFDIRKGTSAYYTTQIFSRFILSSISIKDDFTAAKMFLNLSLSYGDHPEPHFVNLLTNPGIDSQPGGIDSWDVNVYKFGIWLYSRYPTLCD